METKLDRAPLASVIKASFPSTAGNLWPSLNHLPRSISRDRLNIEDFGLKGAAKSII